MQHAVFDLPKPDAMARKAVEAGVGKATRDPASTLILAVLAGAYIGIAFVFYTVVTTGNTGLGWGLNRLIGGLVFSLGLMLVVVNGGELFTSSVLTSVARASRRITTRQMLRNWGLVYLGNALGALALVALLLVARNYEMAGGGVGASYLDIASHKLHHGFGQAVALGILCNFLVCLAVWMTFAASTVTDKLLALVLPVAMFVASGFEHSIANIFMVPMGILSTQVAGPDFWVSIGASPADYADLTWAHFFARNLLPVTLGNIIGGAVFVGLSNWFVHLRGQPGRAARTAAAGVPEQAP